MAGKCARAAERTGARGGVVPRRPHHGAGFAGVIAVGRGGDIVVVGGGIIPDSDKHKLEKMGIRGNFGPGTSLKTIVDFINEEVKKNREGRDKKGSIPKAVSRKSSRSKKSRKKNTGRKK